MSRYPKSDYGTVEREMFQRHDRGFCVRPNPCVCDEGRAALSRIKAENERLREALERIEQVQPEALGYIRHHGFKWEGLGSIGVEPGNWQHLAFSLYSDLSRCSSIALRALQEEG
jgi:hypothetical protein